MHFRGLSAEELRNNLKLRDHGLRVLNTLDKCISRVDEHERLEKLLFELGQKHLMLNIKVEHLDVSKICCIGFAVFCFSVFILLLIQCGDVASNMRAVYWPRKLLY